jgi:hypothetical protein
MVAVKRLIKHQAQTRRIAGWAILGTLVLVWVSLVLFASDLTATPSRMHAPRPPKGMKILYIVTSSKEFNDGDKETQSGQDRLMEILLPALLDGVKTMVPVYQVDVYLILGYELSEERRRIVQDLLPAGVGLQVWNQATPLSYEVLSHYKSNKFLSEASRILARQHRLVIKDKLQFYDFCMAFEDDMLIKKSHIDYYWAVRKEIEKLKTIVGHPTATSRRDSSPDRKSLFDRSRQHWGNLTWDQLDHTFPGFIRVEVLTDPTRPTQSNLGPLSINHRARPDPRICCHGRHVGLQGKLAPQYPHSNQLLMWETAIAGLSIRKMPDHSKLLDWVALLNIKGSPNILAGYWTGTNGALLPEFSKKPPTKDNKYIGQPAGWMASARDIMDLQTRICKGDSFLPPFDEPQLSKDGMGWGSDSVEFWSGGLQLWGQMCEIQRVVSLDPLQFSKHLIYHTANNKQKEIGQERLVKVPTLLGQLDTVKERAQADMKRQLGQKTLFQKLFSWASFGTTEK